MKAIDDRYLPLPGDDELRSERIEKMASLREAIYRRYWCRDDDYWLDNAYGETSAYAFDDAMLVESGENFNDAVFIVLKRKKYLVENRELWLFKLTNDGWKIADSLIFDQS